MGAHSNTLAFKSCTVRQRSSGHTNNGIRWFRQGNVLRALKRLWELVGDPIFAEISCWGFAPYYYFDFINQIAVFAMSLSCLSCLISILLANSFLLQHQSRSTATDYEPRCSDCHSFADKHLFCSIGQLNWHIRPHMFYSIKKTRDLDSFKMTPVSQLLTKADILSQSFTTPLLGIKLDLQI